MPLQILAALIGVQLVVSVFMFLQSRQTRRLDQRLFSVVVFVIAAWTTANMLLLPVNDSNSSRIPYFTIVNQCAFAMACFAIAVIYGFSMTYPVRGRFVGWRRPVLVAGLALGCLAPLRIFSGSFTEHGGRIVYHYGPLVVAIVAFSLFVIGGMYINAVRIFRHGRDIRLRRQAFTLLVGITLTVLHSLLFIIALPAILGQHTILYAIGYAAPYYLILFTAYGLLRQGLFDVRFIIARTVAYFFSFTIASLLYAAPAVFAATYLTHTPLHFSTTLYLVAITLFVAFFFQRLRNYFNKLTNKVFYNDAYDSQRLFNAFNLALVSTIELDGMVSRALEVVSSNLKSEFVMVVIRQPDSTTPRIVSTALGKRFRGDFHQYHTKKMLEGAFEPVIVTSMLPPEQQELRHSLERNNIAILARLDAGSDRSREEIGHLILGQKKSGNPYGKQDIRVIEVLANELVIAIQNALRFEEIERFNETLKEKVEDATGNLRRANDKLRKLDQTKDDFISMASHQLRTPLTSVKGYVSMVLDGDGGELTPLQRKLLNQSFISAQRMVYLISDLLNVSRLRTGKFVIETTPVNLASIVRDEVGQLIETAKGRGLTLTYEKPEHFPTFMLDETKTRQVIMNFLDNAIYYTARGGHIDVRLLDKPQSVELLVTDTGIGVPKAEQPHLFTKFYRAHNAKRARPDGTGLGLFMAKKVVIAQGGAIVFKSTEGKGSTFGFTFAKEKLSSPTPSRPTA